jgi:hypothetical protein
VEVRCSALHALAARRDRVGQVDLLHALRFVVQHEPRLHLLLGRDGVDVDDEPEVVEATADLGHAVGGRGRVGSVARAGSAHGRGARADWRRVDAIARCGARREYGAHGRDAMLPVEDGARLRERLVALALLRAMAARETGGTRRRARTDGGEPTVAMRA